MGMIRSTMAFGTGAFVGFAAGGPIGAIVGGFVAKRLMNWMDKEDHIHRYDNTDSDEPIYLPSAKEQGCPPPWFNGSSYGP